MNADVYSVRLANRGIRRLALTWAILSLFVFFLPFQPHSYTATVKIVEASSPFGQGSIETASTSSGLGGSTVFQQTLVVWDYQEDLSTGLELESDAIRAPPAARSL